ncbi:cation/H(+) antiporter 15-like [Punica granatum]|nr:cation/H(+) antiporter 15-like [Punica granatum]
MLGKLHMFGERGLFPKKELAITGTMGSLGIAYFIFLVAVKMDITMLRRTAKAAMIIGSLSVLVPYVTIVAVTYLRPISGIRPGFFRFLFASGLSVTRFANVADAFDELDMLTSQQGQLVLSSTMLNEIFTWMSLVTGVCYRHRHNHLIPVWLLITVVAVGATAVAMRALAKKIIARFTRKGMQVNEILVTTILVAALLMAFVTDLIGSLHLGILIMGLVMPDGPPLGSAIVERAEYMVKEFMMPVFYVLVGYSTDIFSVNSKGFWEIIVFVILGFIAKFLATLFGALACQQKLRNAVLLGLMVNVKGPIDLYLLTRWRFQKDVEKDTHAILVMSHVMLTALMTPLIEKLYKRSQKLNASDRKNMKAIQTSSSYDEFKVLCCIHGEDNIPGMISLLEASSGSRLLSAVIVHLNDLVGRAAPLVVRNDRKFRRVETNKSDRIAHEFESHIRNSTNPTKITNFTMVAPYKTMHENICHLAQKEDATLIIMPYKKVQGDAGASEAVVSQAMAMRNLNCHMLGCNPCAIGIFVNKGLGWCLGHYSFSCSVAVIFSGGHDDREALAYANRMLMHLSVRVTLLKLIVRCPSGHVEDMLEKKLDDALVEEFRIKIREDSQAQYYEKAAENLIGTLNAIRALGNHYNLVITGRQSSLLMSMFEESLDTQKSWGENPELGIVGDFIASDDYNGGKSSALIMQRYPSSVDLWRGQSRSSAHYEEDYLLGRLP